MLLLAEGRAKQHPDGDYLFYGTWARSAGRLDKCDIGSTWLRR